MGPLQEVSPQPVREYGMLIFNKMLNICVLDVGALSIHQLG